MQKSWTFCGNPALQIVISSGFMVKHWHTFYKTLLQTQILNISEVKWSSSQSRRKPIQNNLLNSYAFHRKQTYDQQKTWPTHLCNQNIHQTLLMNIRWLKSTAIDSLWLTAHFSQVALLAPSVKRENTNALKLSASFPGTQTDWAMQRTSSSLFQNNTS